MLLPPPAFAAEALVAACRAVGPCGRGSSFLPFCGLDHRTDNSEQRIERANNLRPNKLRKFDHRTDTSRDLSAGVEADNTKNWPAKKISEDKTDYEECLSCQ